MGFESELWVDTRTAERSLRATVPGGEEPVDTVVLTHLRFWNLDDLAVVPERWAGLPPADAPSSATTKMPFEGGLGARRATVAAKRCYKSSYWIPWNVAAGCEFKRDARPSVHPSICKTPSST